MDKRPESLEYRFARIAREYKDTIYMVCYMFSKDTQEVDDLYQDILINIWKSLPSFEGRSNLKTWIWRLSLNTCISYDRRRSSRPAALPLDLNINLYEDSDHETKQIKMLHQRINCLGVFDRAIIMLWLENMSYEEIGAIVGISAKNVGVN